MKIFKFFLLLFVFGFSFSETWAQFSQFSSCASGDNDYLEKPLAKRRQDQLDSTISACKVTSSVLDTSAITHSISALNKSFPEACVLETLKNANPQSWRRRVHYGVCDKPGQLIPRYKKINCPTGQDCLLPPPCLSQNYFNAVYSGFIGATSCVGVDPREIYPLFSFESSMAMNIGSATNDWGPGQLNSGGLKGFDWEKEFQNLSLKAECTAERNTLSHPMSDKFSFCERIEFPTNPDRNFIYASIIYKRNKTIANNLVQKFLSMRAKNKSVSSVESNRLAVILTRYSYNAGAGGISQAFLSFVEENGMMNHPLPEIAAKFPDYIRKHFGDGVDYFKTHPALVASIRKAAPNYVLGIDAMADNLNKKVGFKCDL